MKKTMRVSSVRLQTDNDSTLEVCDDADGEMSICTSDGDWFCFNASEAEDVISVIRDMAKKSLSRVEPVEPVEPEKPEVAKEAVVRHTRIRR